MKAICIRARLKKGSVDEVRNWFATLKNRMEELLITLSNEGVVVESVFLDSIGDEHFLIYYMKAKDLDTAFEVFKKSSLPIDIYHKECWQKFCETRDVLEELLDVDRIT